MNEPTVCGTAPDGATVHACTIGSSDLSATILTYGATLDRLVWHTPEGDVDVVLGFATLEGRLANPEGYLGAVVGPFAGRIAGARTTTDGVERRLTANDGPNCLHGGDAGTDAATWSIDSREADRLVLTHTIPDGRGGFPGPIDVTATYTVDGAALTVDLAATTARPTVISLTNHAYLNLAGTGAVDAHTLRVPADTLLRVDDTGIPLERQDVADAGLDLRAPVVLGEARRRDVPLVRALGGLDLPYLPEGDGVRLVAELAHPATGRRVEVFSDRSALQVYTAGALTTSAPGHDGRLLRQGDGVALEPQQLPDSANQAWMPSPVVRPGERFGSTITWRFSRT